MKAPWEQSNEPECMMITEENKTVITNGEKFIINPYYGEEFLTVEQALDLLHHVTGVLLIHERS